MMRLHFWHLSGFTLYLYLLTGILCERWKSGNVHLSCRFIISQIRSTGNARRYLVTLSQLPAHGRHPLHDRHTRYALHGARSEIGSAIRAEFPAQLKQTLAFGASRFELLAAGRTNLEVRLHARVTVIAGRAFGHLGQ